MSDTKDEKVTAESSGEVDIVSKYNDLVKNKIPWLKVKTLPFGIGDLVKEIVEYVGVLVSRIRLLEKKLKHLEDSVAEQKK